MAAKNYGPHEATLLVSAARTETTNTDDQINDGWKGLYYFFDITAVPGIDTVQVKVQVKNPVSGAYTSIFDGAELSETGLTVVVIYPTALDGSGALAGVGEVGLPRTWRIQILHSGEGSFTYYLAVCMLP